MSFDERQLKLMAGWSGYGSKEIERIYLNQGSGLEFGSV